MNKQRRAALDAILSELETQRDALRTITDEEQEAFDNMPQSLQEAEKGQTMESGIDSMEDAINNLQEVADLLRDVIDA